MGRPRALRHSIGAPAPGPGAPDAGIPAPRVPPETMKRGLEGGPTRKEEVDSHDDDDEREMPTGYARASKEQMAKRAIVRVSAKRKKAFRKAAEEKPAGQNPFGGFGGFGGFGSAAPAAAPAASGPAKVTFGAPAAGGSAGGPAKVSFGAPAAAGPAKVSFGAPAAAEPAKVSFGAPAAAGPAKVSFGAATPAAAAAPRRVSFDAAAARPRKDTPAPASFKRTAGERSKLGKLNAGFVRWALRQKAEKPSSSWSEGVKDYLMFARRILGEDESLGPSVMPEDEVLTEVKKPGAAGGADSPVEYPDSDDDANGGGPVVPVAGGWGNLMDKYKPKAGSWRCKVCLIDNDAGKAKCVGCEAARDAGAAEDAAPKPQRGAFSLSSAAAPPAGAPKVTFGAPKAAGAGGFSFSGGAAPEPKAGGFTFKPASLSGAEQAPAGGGGFKIGGFGAGKAASAPEAGGFSFSAAPAEAPKAGGFSFSGGAAPAATAASGFSFGKADGGGAGAEEAEAEAEKEEPSVVERGDDGDEEARFEAKAKAMRLKDGAWAEMGVGTLRVMVHKVESGKSRVVARNQVGKVFFNAALYKGLKAEKRGKMNVAFVANLEGLGPVNVVLKCKDQEGLYQAIVKHTPAA